MILPWDIMALLAVAGCAVGMFLMGMVWNAWPRIDEPRADKAKTHLRDDVARIDENIAELINYRRELLRADRRLRKRSRKHGKTKRTRPN